MGALPDRVDYELKNIYNHINRIRSKGVAEVPQRFINELDVQDACILNLHRTLQAAFDLASYVIAEELKLPLPETPKEYFALLQEHGWISPETAKQVAILADLRHITVNQPIRATDLIEVVVNRLGFLIDFRGEIMNRYLKRS